MHLWVHTCADVHIMHHSCSYWQPFCDMHTIIFRQSEDGTIPSLRLLSYGRADYCEKEAKKSVPDQSIRNISVNSMLVFFFFSFRLKNVKGFCLWKADKQQLSASMKTYKWHTQKNYLYSLITGYILIMIYAIYCTITVLQTALWNLKSLSNILSDGVFWKACWMVLLIHKELMPNI